MGLTVLYGGARSGKSALGVRLAAVADTPVTFIATAQARDIEMTERIRKHQASRPSDWRTVEEPVDLEGALRGVPDEDGVLLDCLSLWVSNLMERELTDTQVQRRAERVAALAAKRTGPTIAISNEVGWGIVPQNDLARAYRDVLGRVNTAWASHAQRAVLVVAGRIVHLSSADLLLDNPADD